ncbi:MAG TPA: TraB/GumN family protein [Burkholderiales bacterium]|nr:TraB/GumN family protein [Burkholderiales bacterium]
MSAFLLFALAVATFNVDAREAGARSSAPQQRQGLLWKIDKPGVPPSYLFGTIHLSDERVTRVPEAVEKALERSKSYGMEMIVDDSARAYFLHSMQAAEGQSARDLLDPELFQRAAALMREYGVPEEATARMKPWGVLLTLLVPKPGSTPVLDFRLYEEATRQGKRIYPLESIEQQVAVFDGMRLPMQIALLESAIENHAELTRVVADSIEAYLARDLERLWELNERYARDSGEAARYHKDFVERVLYRRNRHMAERISRELARGDTFVALGALHLYGDRGVLRLLEERGYRVRRVY